MLVLHNLTISLNIHPGIASQDDDFKAEEKEPSADPFHGEQRAGAAVRDRAGELSGDGRACAERPLGAHHARGPEDRPARPARRRTPR